MLVTIGAPVAVDNPYRRQIGAFHLPGDIFGLENGDLHRFTAEAIVDTTVRFVKRLSLESAVYCDPAMARALLTMTAQNLQHVQNHMLLLGRKKQHFSLR